MLIHALARSKLRDASTTLYTGGDATVDVRTRVNIADGVVMFGRRNSNVLTGFMFGDDDAVAYRMGSSFTDWDGGSSAYDQAVSGLTITPGNLNMTTAFPWNDSAYPTEPYIAWAVGGASATVVTWTGTGGSPSAVSHSLGTTVGAALIVGTQTSSGTVSRWGYFDARPNYTMNFSATGSPSGWNDAGTAVLANTTTTATPGASTSFDLSGYTYKAVLFPTTSSRIACGLTSSGVAESIGWQPQTLIMSGSLGRLYNWDSLRDGTGLSSNGDTFSTNMSGESALSSHAFLSGISSTGFTTVGDQYYIAIR